MKTIKAVSAFIHDGDNYLILKKRRPWIGWQFPQGKIKENESENDALKREIEEETGLKFISFEKLPFTGGYNYKIDEENVHKELIFYEVKASSDEDIQFGEEHSEYKWVSEEEVIGMLQYEDQKDSFRKFISFKAKVPSKEECNELLREYTVPKHVIKHSKKVADVAVLLGEKLIENGEYVNLDLTYVAAMLHDLVRICDFKELSYDNFEQVITPEDEEKWEELRRLYKGMHHADAAAKILSILGYKVLANIIKRHKYIIIKDRLERPKSWEEKLVYYADKRVMHDKIVSLRERFEDGKIRNAHLIEMRSERPEYVESIIFNLEKEIFDKIGMQPEDIV